MVWYGPHFFTRELGWVVFLGPNPTDPLSTPGWKAEPRGATNLVETFDLFLKGELD
jgi:hypothetical protein